MAMGRNLHYLIALALSLLFASSAEAKFTLVIDAGHGGNDAGAVGKISKEKDINLQVALSFGRYVERQCPDVKVIYTRRKDVFVPLHERANIANRNKADLFVSIHTNALPGGKRGTGLETYTLGMSRAADNFDVAKRENSVILIESDYKQRYEGFDPRSSESYIMFEFLQDKNMEHSVELAKSVQRRACAAASRPNKGVKQAGFLVLRETSMPSCLIELGFITTAEEEQQLNSGTTVDALGRGIYEAFCDYRRKFDKAFKAPVPIEADSQQPAAQPGNAIAAAPQPDTARPTASTPEAAQPKTRKRNQTPRDEGAEVLAALRGIGSPDTRQDKPAKRGGGTVDEVPAKPVSDTPAPEIRKPAGEAPTVGRGPAPVFKVQITTSDRPLSAGSAQISGVEDLDNYFENGLYKYTAGASTDYNQIYQLRKRLIGRYPDAFIIAFKDGKKTNVNEAIAEYKRNKLNK